MLQYVRILDRLTLYIIFEEFAHSEVVCSDETINRASNNLSISENHLGHRVFEVIKHLYWLELRAKQVPNFNSVVERPRCNYIFRHVKGNGIDS